MQGPMQRVNPIDPETGGYRLRGIADKGGIAYRPILGAPGFTPIAPTAIPTLFKETDNLKLIDYKMDLLVDAAIKSGILLKLPE
jgi:hypothetical protein